MTNDDIIQIIPAQNNMYVEVKGNDEEPGLISRVIYINLWDDSRVTYTTVTEEGIIEFIDEDDINPCGYCKVIFKGE